MELIKIEKLDPALMEEVTLTEEECDNLLQEITNIVESPDDVSINKAIREFAHTEPISEINLSNAALTGVSSAAVGALVLIGMIRKLIKNKYGMAAKKLLDQSKEINDLYTKIEDLLKHDKMARFKHRNDKISTEQKYIILQDRRNGKMYNIIIDYLGYDSDSVMAVVNNMMDYLNQAKPEDEDILITNWAETTIADIDKSFEENHWYVVQCQPLLKTEVFKSVKLEKVIMAYKNTFSSIYYWVAAFNKAISTQMTYLQVLEKAYKSAITTHGSTKARKDAIDRLFKHLLELSTKMHHFQYFVMDVLAEEIKYYAGELERIYIF